jgi:hypothetical protein
MKARAVWEDPSPSSPAIGRAIVASWMPGRFHHITTLMCGGSAPLARLTESMITGIPFADIREARCRFVTQIIKCDRDGISSEDDYMSPVYEREYDNADAAKEGHKIILDLFAKGRALPK